MAINVDLRDSFIDALKSQSHLFSGGTGHSPSPGRTSIGGASIQGYGTSFVEELKEANKSWISSLLDSSKANKSYAHRTADLAAATEMLGNKYLDSAAKAVKGINEKLVATGSATAKELQRQIETMGPRGMFDFISQIGATVDNFAKDLEKTGKVSFKEISRGFSRSATDMIDAGTAAYEPLKNIKQSANALSDSLSTTSQSTLKDLNENKAISNKAARLLAREMDTASKDLTESFKALEANAKKEIIRANAKKTAEDGLRKALGLSEVSLTGFSLAALAATAKIYNEFKMVAAAGLSDHFFTLSANAIELGITTEKLTKIYRENSRMLLLSGINNFQNSLYKGVNGLNKLGIFGEEAANGVASFAKAAVDSGIDPKNAKAIDDSIVKQTNAFNILRKVTGATIEEFNSMNAAMVENSTNQMLSLRLAPEERNARYHELVSLREEFALRGLSAKAADEMVTAMQGFQKTKFKDRYEASMRLQQLGGILGMGAEGRRAGELTLKRNRTDLEAAELGGLTANMKGAMEQFGNAGFMQENLMDIMDDSMGSAAKGLLDASVQLKLAADGMKGVTKEQAMMAGEASKLSPSTHATIKAIETMTNALQTPLFLLVGSVGGILTMMGGQMVGKLLNMIPGGSLLGRLIPVLTKGLKFLGLFGAIATAIIVPLKGMYDTFTEFSKYMSFDNILGSLSALLIGAAGSFAEMFIDTFMGIPSKILKGLGLDWFNGSWTKSITDTITESTDSAKAEQLGLSDKQLQEIKNKRAKEKSDSLLKENTAATAANTKAVARTSEQYVGATSLSSISAKSLRNDTLYSINNPMGAEKLPTNTTQKTETDQQTAEKTTSSQQSSSKKESTNEDILKKLQDILDASIENNAELVRAVQQLKRSGFPSNSARQLN